MRGTHRIARTSKRSDKAPKVRFSKGISDKSGGDAFFTYFLVISQGNNERETFCIDDGEQLNSSSTISFQH
jgi:hypothetical protein